MNLAAFAVVVARERETPYGDDLRALHGLGADRPWLAWPMTIAMLSLAGFPATAGFFGKIYLIEAAVDNEYAFLGVAIVLGSAISLAYYLRVVAAVWLAAPDESRAPAAGRRARAGDRGRLARRPTPRTAQPRGALRRLRAARGRRSSRSCARSRRSRWGSTPSRCSTSRKDAGAALDRRCSSSRSARGSARCRASMPSWASSSER